MSADRASTNGFVRTQAAGKPVRGEDAAENLASALEQRGGVYLSFAEFLLWRSDLLTADYLAALRQIDYARPPVPREAVAALLRREFAPDGGDLAGKMEAEPVWSTGSRTAYLSWYGSRKIVIQVPRDPVPESDLASFETQVRALQHPAVALIATPAVLGEFRQWLRLGDSSATERAYLEHINRSFGKTIAHYPLLIRELSNDDVLCWDWVEGEPVTSLIRLGNVDAVTKVAIGVLEQYCSLSVIDGEFSCDAMAISSEEPPQLVFRRFNRPVEVPLAMVDVGMKYFAAVLEGNSLAAAQALANLTFGRPVASLERDLLGLMAASEPELKGDLWFPESAGAFEGNWKAATGLQVDRPLYINCLHRNLMAIGYWTGTAVQSGGTATDTITDAHWPVLEQVLKTNASRFLKPAVVTEWSVSLGLLGLRTVRETGRLAEEIRDNNLMMDVEIGERPSGAAPKVGHNVRVGVSIACLLAALLAIIRYGGTVPHLQVVVVAIGSALLLALFWSFAKLR